MNPVKTTSEFKAQTSKAIISIAFFIVSYVIILMLAIILTFLCVYGSVLLIIGFPRFFTIALGIGLASLGFLILIFLLKFLFNSHKVDRSYLVEISKAEEPKLFKLIEEIVDEVNTSFPKKVYLTTDVNAAVFYDSSFWSMFLPIKKNLQIGMGLVNTLTETEFKAVLAHEFGHFSQKTMKVGSYVYNVNQVIFNMLFDNKSYDKLIQKWSNVSNYFTIFVIIAAKIIEGIQWILRKLYTVVNKSYMGLSREMEFHADEIAASIAGNEPLISSLLRMNLADYSFNEVINFYKSKLSNNSKSENLYREQSFIMNFIAEKNGITIKNNLPFVKLNELNKFNKSRLVIKNQWASHPTTDERIERLTKLNYSSSHKLNKSANEIFSNNEETQKKITIRIFGESNNQDEATLFFDEFRRRYEENFFKSTFSEIYNGYYDNKNPIPFDISIVKQAGESSTSINELFSSDKIELVYVAIALKNDIEVLKQIGKKILNIKSFDYDGEKYKVSQSNQLTTKLEIELEQLNNQIKRNDIKIYQFFKNAEEDHASTPLLCGLYHSFFEFDNVFDTKYAIYTQLSNDLQFINVTTPISEIRENLFKLRPMEEKLKQGIKELIANKLCSTEIDNEMKDNFDYFLSHNLDYFGSTQYNNESLNIFLEALNNYGFLLSRSYFLIKKQLLDYQIKLISN